MYSLSDKTKDTLRRLRGKRSIEEAAEGIGITPRSLLSYERGERVPRDAVKIKIAEYYGRSVKYIFFN